MSIPESRVCTLFSTNGITDRNFDCDWLKKVEFVVRFLVKIWDEQLSSFKHYTEEDFWKFDCIIDKIQCSLHVFTNSGFSWILYLDRFFWRKTPIKQQQSLRLIVKIRNSFFVKIWYEQLSRFIYFFTHFESVVSSNQRTFGLANQIIFDKKNQ